MPPFSLSSDAIAEAKVPLPDFIHALLLIKSKPSTISCRDYLLHLRSCIQDERRPDNNSLSNRHVDATAYWRDAYTKSEEVQITLRARVAELESRLAALGESKIAPSVVASSQRKRKRGANEDTEASGSRRQKHARTTRSNAADTVTLTASEEDLASLMAKVDGFESDPPGNAFLHHLYILQQLLNKIRPDPKDLAATLCCISSCVCRLVSNVHATEDVGVVKPPGPSKSSTRKQEKTPALVPNPTEEGITGQLLAVRKAFQYLLKGLDRLDRLPDTEARKIKGQVIWAFVKILHDVLGRICELSATRIHETPTTMPAMPAARAQGLQQSIAMPEGFPAAARVRASCQACHERHLKCDGGLPDCQHCKKGKRECKRRVPLHFTNAAVTNTLVTPPTGNMLILCEFAIALMAHLDTSKNMHKEIMEGFLFFLLRRVGQGLKYFTVGAEREWGIHDTDYAVRIGDSRDEDEIMEAQAPCLIWIFQQAHAFIKPVSGYASRKPLASLREPLSTIEKHRLQNTMLKAIFGDEVAADDQPALKSPSSPLDNGFFGRLAEELKERQIGVKDWYKHEVWRLVGWDCLVGKVP